MASAPITIPPSKPTTAQLFGQRVASGTGLDPLVVAVWIAAEGGPVDNPLNIMSVDEKGRQTVSRFGTWQAAADATIRNLRTPLYAPVLKAAATGQPKAQLDAIAASPWDAGHYRGLDKNGNVITSNKPGALLYGIWTSVFGGPPLAGSTHQTAADPTVDPTTGSKIVAGSTVDRQGNVTQGFSVGGLESWLGGAALSAGAYALLTIAALALFAIGMNQLLGGAPGRAAAGLATRTPAGEVIPF